MVKEIENQEGWSCFPRNGVEVFFFLMFMTICQISFLNIAEQTLEYSFVVQQSFHISFTKQPMHTAMLLKEQSFTTTKKTSEA